MTDNEDNPRRLRSHSRTPSINSSDFTVNPFYYNVNVSDTSLMTTTSSSLLDSDDEDNEANDNRSGNKFDAIEYLLKIVNSSLSSLELDRSIVVQSRLSGLLNNKSQELVSKIEELQEFLKECHMKILQYEKTTIPSLVKELNKSEKKVAKLTSLMKRDHPIEYQKSKEKIVNRLSDEDADLYV